jgi:hypothetical protein
VANPGSPAVGVSQNDELIWASTTGADTTFGADFVNSDDTFTITSTKVLSFDLNHNAQDSGTWKVGFWPALPSTSTANRIGFGGGAGTGDVRTELMESSTLTLGTDHTLDVSTTKTMKIEIDSANSTFSYWNGSSWTQLDTSAHTTTGPMYVVILYRNQASSGSANGDTMTIDNLYVSDADFSTRYPV